MRAKTAAAALTGRNDNAESAFQMERPHTRAHASLDGDEPLMNDPNAD
jgi:hypothetical protein